MDKAQPQGPIATLCWTFKTFELCVTLLLLAVTALLYTALLCSDSIA